MNPVRSPGKKNFRENFSCAGLSGENAITKNKKTSEHIKTDF